VPTRIIIKAVPGRDQFFPYLRRHLPHAEWCMDIGRGATDTFLRGLEMSGDDASIHMEDDVILTRDFVAKVEAAIAARPSEMIQFFSMRKDDLTVGSRYDRAFMMNQCHYFPPGHCRLLLEYARVWPGWATDPTGYDTLMQQWMRSRKERYWIHCPSLVDHRVARSVINPRRSSRRQSLTFVDPVED
jgi:hypothetical protein